MKYTVSVLQYKPEFLKPKQNFALLSSMLKEIKSDLIVLPELATSGYVFAHQDEVAKIAESIPEGEIFQGFRALSKSINSSIVYGFAEKAADKYYNSSALVNPDGSYDIYRKIHLYFREKLFFSPGESPFEVSTAKSGVKIGMMVCFDWQFPESARSLALKGAQILCHPSNLVLPWCQQAMITRSLENRVFSITSNRTGTEINGEHKHYFTGKSQILGTKGEILIRMNDTEAGVYSVEIDPELASNKQVTEMNSVFSDRRPLMYYLP
ncbi:MAG: nitrilase-related carbon-nitrogen hydrolase [Candidatus Cloacimonadaceae bacterium]|jgi:predicted amidohydrolase|nr:beta-ureidopropionase [Candidatus Cloacimonadota bacterium]MDY0127033.1 nitrilase-related carbon-nitrogen hydrolase [Candidatus Cloacimonadaceae bacterium]MCB5254105.1 beta-ureidopropionase [Candidatus Cloacimonadota bacterium]MCK9177692.1 beta-ureidopropionase [Candidatus Cloacimonadota bacterium]MCK9241665.1 beta-ureidopropionase [Candidatus Cloacimonadota bacterium]